MEPLQHTKGSSAMQLLQQQGNLTALSGAVALQAEENGTQKGHKVFLEARTGSVPREKRSTGSKLRQVSGSMSRKATQTGSMGQGLCRPSRGILPRGVQQSKRSSSQRSGELEHTLSGPRGGNGAQSRVALLEAAQQWQG